MRRVAIVLGTAGVLGAGVAAAVALGSSSSLKDGTVSTTTTTEQAVPKVWLCHHTGSWKHPYHLIHVSGHAVAAHRRHGDVDPGAGNTCPTVQPAGTKQHAKGGAAGKTHGDDKGDAADDDGEKDTEFHP
jgi:hypothetical protein